MKNSSRIRPIGALKNIGLSLARQLQSVGIHDEHDLRSAGSIGAFRKLVRRYPSAATSLWTSIYYLEGAIRDLPWNKIPRERMRALLKSLASPPRLSS